MNVFTVRELTRYIKSIIDSDPVLHNVWVRGEVSNFKLHSSGHVYFTLKDHDAVLRCVMFRSRAELLAFKPANGIKVLVLGRVGVYERDGQYQLYVDEMQPDGLGALYLAFEQLKARLAAEGLFERVRKRMPPLLPRKVGIVTSPTGAAIRDILTVSLRRFPGAHLVIAPVQVQGVGAGEQIARGIELVQKVDGIDVIIVGRGGGSMEELWAFNEEVVVRSIYNSRVPVISAVGHETDYTLSDLVADVRAPTPSAAAEMAFPDRRYLQGQVRLLTVRLVQGLDRQVKAKRQRLNQVMMSPYLTHPTARLDEQKQYVDELARTLLRTVKGLVDQKKLALQVGIARLDALSPLKVLQRGYSICRKMLDGTIVKDSMDVDIGDRVDVLLARGAIQCEVAGRKKT